MNKYSGILAKEMDDFLNLYVSMGYSVTGYITVFNKLDILLSDINLTEKVIAKETAERFSCELKVRPYCFYNYISHYNIFARYLKSLGIVAYELDLPKQSSDYTPYIFTQDEWLRIIEAADNFNINRCPLYSVQIPLLIRILYGCGTRINETLSLKVENIDLHRGVLHLRKAKNKHERLVPMDESLTNIIKQYIVTQHLNSNDYLFYLQRKNEKWTVHSADNCFEHILKKANIKFHREKAYDRGPCLHCFRHTFVLNSLKKSEKFHKTFDEIAPFISVYLGHSSINETNKYLNFYYELYDEAIDSIESYTANIFPEVQ